MRVFFATSNARFDISTAVQFGEISYVFEGSRPSPLNTQELYDRTLRALEEADFDCTKDSIALTGSSIFASVLFAVVIAEYDSCRTLVFDAARDKYRLAVVGSYAEGRLK